LDCYVEAAIDCIGVTGGIVGHGNFVNISDCYSDCIIQGTDCRYDLGGICGKSTDSIVNKCHSFGLIVANASSINVGGICGNNYRSDISKCYSLASVSGYEVIGGLCGYNQEGTISNSFSRGTVYGDKDTGGLCGRMYGSAIIENTYSSAAVTASVITPNIGGLLGFLHSGNIYRSYFLDSVGPDNGNGLALTDIQMKQQLSFDNWDFNDIWDICEGTNYPKLQWSNIIAGNFHCPDRVDFIDYAELMDQWKMIKYEADFNSDGLVDFYDYAQYVLNYDNNLDSLKTHLDYWLIVGASDADIAPLGGDGTVNLKDLMLLCDNWLME